jgi:VIT1/CCC1 family predicted Fe2+/Mn2+ transporter
VSSSRAVAPTSPPVRLEEAAAYFAYNQYRDYVVYTELAAIETNADFKRILEELVGHEIEDYRFWLELSREKVFRVPRLLVAAYKLVRRVLGLTFTAKLLERRETEMIRRYSSLLGGVADEKVRRGISRILEHESYHEAQLIGQVHEQKIQFLSSVILGLNDGLIELTGALVGFSFALRRTALVALTGLITGVAASLSMAASAYMQARHEPGKDPRRAATYTGLSYFVVVCLLVAPFLVFDDVFGALAVMGAIVLAILASVSFYSAVLQEVGFRRRFLEMTVLSVGVAAIAFAIGWAFRSLTGIEL